MTPTQNTKAGPLPVHTAPTDARGWPAVARQVSPSSHAPGFGTLAGEGDQAPARIPWHHGFAEAS